MFITKFADIYQC